MVFLFPTSRFVIGSVSLCTPYSDSAGGYKGKSGYETESNFSMSFKK
jgi:hypothetical protein